jgi:hypothetical protein
MPRRLRESTQNASARQSDISKSIPNSNSGNCGPAFRTYSAGPNAGRPALFHCGAIASRASNILPDSGAQFHRDETNRQTVDANTQLCGSVQTAFGNNTGSGPAAMGAAKRDGPSVQRGHNASVSAFHDICAASAGGHPLLGRTQNLFKIAPIARTDGSVARFCWPATHGTW